MFTVIHRIIFLILLGYISLLLSSCSFEEETKKNKEIKVGIVLYDSKDSFVDTILQSIQKNFPQNITSIIMDSQFDSFLQTQQLAQLVKENVDVLVINPVDEQIASSYIDIAKKNSIPIIFFNKQPSIDDLNLYDKACYIGSNPQSAGIIQAEIINNLWKNHPESDKDNDGKLNFIMLESSPDSITAVARTESVIKHALKLGVPLEQVKQTYFCYWDRSMAKIAIESVISDGLQNVDIIIANSDPMALGALDALEEIGYNLKDGDPNKYIPILGVDGLPEALTAIKQKRMTGTVHQKGNEIGRTIVKAIENALSGKDLIENTGYTWDSSKKIINIPCTYIGDFE